MSVHGLILLLGSSGRSNCSGWAALAMSLTGTLTAILLQSCMGLSGWRPVRFLSALPGWMAGRLVPATVIICFRCFT